MFQMSRKIYGQETTEENVAEIFLIFQDTKDYKSQEL